MSSIRQEKVASLLKRDLAEIFRDKGTNMQPGKMISVTVVRVSPDLRSARVYLSVFPSPDNQDAALKVIRAHGSEVRGALGKLIGKQMRSVPELFFYIDDSLDYAENIDELLG